MATVLAHSWSWKVFAGIDNLSEDDIAYRTLISETSPCFKKWLKNSVYLHCLMQMVLRIMALPGEEHARSWMGVPLVNQGHVVGMMILVKHEYDVLCHALGTTCGICLCESGLLLRWQMRNLFEQTFERTNELGTLLEAAQATALNARSE